MKRVGLLAFGLSGWALFALQASRPVQRKAAAASVEPGAPCASGPWGELRCVEFTIDPPTNLIAPEACRTSGATWSFPGASRDRVGEALVRAAVPPGTRDELLEGLRCETSGCRVTPSTDLIAGLTPTVRRPLYAELGKHPENIGQATPFSLSLAEADAWAVDTGLSARTLALFQRLQYRDERLVYFADLPALCAGTDDVEERTEILRVLMREPSLLVYVRAGDAADLEKLEAYWGRGRRPETLRPLLTSLTRTGQAEWIDIAHLLPRFVRSHLNRFPQPDRPPRSCHWSSMNFFNRQADDSLASDEDVRRTLAEDYVAVDAADVQLGDVVAFYSDKGVLVHSAARITSEIVFTKNGASVRAPWLLMRLPDVAAHYPTATVRYLRRAVLPVY